MRDVENRTIPTSGASLPRAVVINLDRSPDRYAAVTSRFRDVGVELERFPGVDARADPVRSAEALHPGWFRLFAGRDSMLGEIGCALSHFAVWESLDQRPDEALLVLEDDAVPGDLLPHLPLAIEALPDDWEVLVLAENLSTHPWWRRQAGPIGLVRYFRPGYLAVAYVVHRRILRHRHLWNRARPVRFPLDHWRLWSLWYGLVTYSTADAVIHPPWAGGPNPPASTIGSPDSMPKIRGLRAVPGRLMRLALYAVGAARLASAALRTRARGVSNKVGS